jgi:phosphatidylserine decarboxylase
LLTTAYARREIWLIAVVGVAVTVLIGWLFHWWALVPLLLTLALLLFFRDPYRRPPTADNLILAPADGKVVEISRDVPSPDGKGRKLRIMIFLSVFDVHVNRSPCAGRVKEIEYRRGEFLNALSAEADSRNECNTLTIEPHSPLPGPVRVRQIAGVLARRIVCTVCAGDELAGGQRFGMIKLGSRTEVCLPEDRGWKVLVAMGQSVRAGLTVLARLGPPQSPVEAAHDP